MRLPRSRSITERQTFQNVRTKGNSKAGRFFVLGTLEDDALEGLHTGLITTKKIGNAVVRNRARRLFRAVLIKQGEAISPGRYLVFVARYTMKGASFADVEKDFLKLARRLRILKQDGGGE